MDIFHFWYLNIRFIHKRISLPRRRGQLPVDLAKVTN